MKIAIFKDNLVTYNYYVSHRYNLWFRIFGPTIWTCIKGSYTIDDLIKETKSKLFGDLEFIRIEDIGKRNDYGKKI